MDEKPYQLLGDKLVPLPMKPGSVEKVDSQYVRMGTCSISIFTEPLNGWRYCEAFLRRTKKGWAQRIRFVLDTWYLDVEKVVFVVDNLNTYVLSSLCEAFVSEEAFRLVQRMEIYYTLVHGSWLNIAEIELSVLAVQCLGKRWISDVGMLNKELVTWYCERNSNQKGVDWQFTAKKVRVKLKRLYPIIM